jgi:hypothetical protein
LRNNKSGSSFIDTEGEMEDFGVSTTLVAGDSDGFKHVSLK